MTALYVALIITCIPVVWVLYLVYKLLNELDTTDNNFLDDDDV